jgi:hypothetical protein
MQPRRDATKAALRFHRRWLSFLLDATPQTLRRVAHELALLEDENRTYRDGAIFRLLRHETEFVIQDVGGTSWTVQRSLHDRRGKTQQRRPFHVNRDLQLAINRRILPVISERGQL